MSNRQFRTVGMAGFVARMEETVVAFSDFGARKKKIRKLGNCSGQFETQIYRYSHDFKGMFRSMLKFPEAGEG